MIGRLSFDSQVARRRWRFAAALLAVLAVHAVLLLWAAPAWFDGSDAQPAAPPALRVRSIALAAPQAALPTPAAAAAAPAPRALANLRVAARPAVVSVEALPSPPVAAADAAPPSTSDLPADAQAEARDPLPPIDVPVYATQTPPAGQWRYRLQRGPVSGEATLAWAPQADGRYDARLEGRIAGVAVLDWTSRGALDGAGIAPERFALRRRGREQQAANFQREAGKVTFSGPKHELPLLPGVQDRLTWLLQLSAIAAAAPERVAPGAKVVLMVVGARGGAGIWSFTAQRGAEPLIHLVREADVGRAWDQRVEVWLDPARGFLPQRALLAPVNGGAVLALDWEP
jgi:Protein of unknown function (DUF3108)